MTRERSDEIVRLAALVHKIDRDELPEDIAAFDSGMDRLGDDRGLVIFAMKIMEGKPYQINSNRPAFIARYRALAQHLGATIIKEGEVSFGGEIFTSIMFTPAVPS
jgi:hypothetical protein